MCRFARFTLHLLFLLSFLLTLSPTPPVLAATTRLVSPTGSDSGDCSVTACATIAYAVSQAVDGDTIEVAAGTYTESGINVVNKNLTITGARAASTIVQAAASAGTASDRVFRVADPVLPANTVTIERMTIRYGVSGSGGGINNGANLTLNDVTISDNQMTAGNGGGITSNGGSVTLNNSTVSSNTVATSGNGGGIFIRVSSLTLHNSTVSGNSTVGDGGGLFTASTGTINLKYSTVANNTSDSDSSGAGDGGGVRNNGGTVNLMSSIVAGNKKGTSTTDAAADCSGTISSQGYNLTGSSTGCPTGGAGDVTVTPSSVFTTVLGPLANNGGSTYTHALLNASPARDTIPNGTNNCGTAPFNEDQRGKARPFNTTCDMGAYEGQLSINRSSGTPTNAAAVSWTVTFGEAVSGLTSSNLALVNSGLGGAPAISSVTPSGGAPATQWTVTASTGSGDGTLGLNLVNATGLTPTVIDVPFTGQVYTLERTAPDTIITVNPSNPTTSITATFVFTGSDGSGTGVASFECALDGGLSACTSPKNYTGLSQGSHTFQVRAIDNTGNTDPSPASFTWVIDTTAPTVAINSAAPNPTNISPISVIVTFSESVNGFTVGDITVGSATISNFAGSGSSYSFDLIPGGPGLVTADIAAAVAQDIAGNSNTAAAQFSRTFFVAPEIALLGNNTVINNGDPSPSLTDQTDFGDVVLGEAITHTFSISNSGSLALTLSGLPLIALTGPAASDFSVVTDPISPVATNTTTLFQVRFDPSVAGTRVATITIANNDSDENPYDFAIQGVGTAASTSSTTYLPLILK